MEPDETDADVDADADATVSIGGDPPEVVVYWRPGCGYCIRLDHNVKRWGLEVTARNIWEDDEAAAFVRSVARGTETVPTVQVGDEVAVNPPFEWIIHQLGDHAPEPPPGLTDRVRSMFGRS